MGVLTSYCNVVIVINIIVVYITLYCSIATSHLISDTILLGNIYITEM